MKNLNKTNYTQETKTQETREEKPMKNLNITELIKDVNITEEIELSRSYMNEIKTWDVFLIYKYYRDHKDEGNELQFAARTWVELHLVDHLKPEDWEFMLNVLKYVYKHTRTKKYEETIELMLLEELYSGRTSEARQLIKEDSELALAKYKTETEQETEPTIVELVDELETQLNIYWYGNYKPAEGKTWAEASEQIWGNIITLRETIKLYIKEHKFAGIKTDEQGAQVANKLKNINQRIETCEMF